MVHKKKVFLLVAGGVAVLAILLSLCLSAGSGAHRNDDNLHERTSQNTGQDFEEQTEKGYFRLLVSGVDRASGLSDVLMLVSICRDTGEIRILQLPRDTYASYTERSYRKLNGAPSLLGLSETKAFLSEALGISIDRYVRISLDTVRKAVDAVGGVEITIDKPMRYEDPEQGLSILLNAGTQTLNGAQAEQFLRFRAGYVNGDLGRIEAQKIFLSALFQKMKNEFHAWSAIKLATVLWGDVKTDLTLPELTWLIPELYESKSERIFLVTAPGEAAIAKASGASYYVLSHPAMEELLCAHFGASEKGFDPQGVFLNRENRDFSVIYKKYVSFSIFSADSSDKNGVE